MKPWQKAVKYCAIALAVILIINIISWALTVCGLILGVSSSIVSDESQSFEFSAENDVLNIKISAASLTIRAEECDTVKVTTNLKRLTAKESDGKLTVKEKSRFFTVTDSKAYVEIVYPIGTSFDKVDVEGGGGKLSISSLVTDKLSLELGAGETLLESVTVKNEVEINGGAGALTVKKSEITDLKLEMGVGEFRFDGVLLGKNKIALGIGDARLTLDGGKESYTLDLEKGIGEIKVDGAVVGNSKVGDGETRIDIEGGIGSIRIDFADSAE